MPILRTSFVFRIETGTPATFWSGHGNLILPPDHVLSEPTIIPGAGELINIPELEELINGVAQRIEITLSGVAQETLALAQEELPDVPGAPVHIGRIHFDETWQLASEIEWEWSGEGVNLTIGSEMSENGRARTLTLRVSTGDTTRSRAAIAFFTDADQRVNFPTDAFFSHVAGINSGTSRRWGPS